jgi:PAS domain S-box-containing protein
VELVGSPSPAWLGVPLKIPTATIGVLVVQHYQNQNAYDLRDLEFMESVGGHIALAIERRRAEEELRRNESILRLLFEQNPLPIWLYELETLRFLRVNEAAVELYGYSAEEFESLSVTDIQPPSQRNREYELAKRPGEREFWLHQAKNGRTFEVELISHELEYAGKRVGLVVAQDISERRHLESQLRQAQKMEAVGRLAGGVAHDFNNLLMVIKGHTELLLNALDSSDQITRKIEQIDKSADRASALTRQLLAFSRRQVLQPQVMNVNSTIEEMGKLLPRLIGEDIELIIRTDKKLGTVRADASQMEQVIMNLAVNARDAMPNGGKLLIETANINIDHSYTQSHPLMKAGAYVLLTVTDNGTGMDAETQGHIFEPFFTTKEKGKGTGLGLAMVYGIVKQSGGVIWEGNVFQNLFAARGTSGAISDGTPAEPGCADGLGNGAAYRRRAGRAGNRAAVPGVRRLSGHRSEKWSGRDSTGGGASRQDPATGHGHGHAGNDRTRAGGAAANGTPGIERGVHVRLQRTCRDRNGGCRSVRAPAH